MTLRTDYGGQHTCPKSILPGLSRMGHVCPDAACMLVTSEIQWCSDWEFSSFLMVRQGAFSGIVWVSTIKSVVGKHIHAVFKFSLIINSGEVALLLILVNVQLKAQMSGNFHKWIQLHLIVLLMREDLMKTNRWSI